MSDKDKITWDKFELFSRYDIKDNGESNVVVDAWAINIHPSNFTKNNLHDTNWIL